MVYIQVNYMSYTKCKHWCVEVSVDSGHYTN